MYGIWHMASISAYAFGFPSRTAEYEYETSMGEMLGIVVHAWRGWSYVLLPTGHGSL